MGLVEELAAIRARTDLSYEDRARQHGALKARALAQAVSVPHTFAFARDGVDYAVTIQAMAVDGNRLTVRVAIWRDGGSVTFDRHTFVNPPHVVPGGSVDPLAALQLIVADAVAEP